MSLLLCFYQNVKSVIYTKGGINMDDVDGSKKLVFGLENIKQKDIMHTPSGISKEKNTELLSVRVSAEILLSLDEFQRELRVSKSEVVRRLLKVAVVREHDVIAPKMITEAITIQFNREVYMRYMNTLIDCGVPLTDELKKNIREHLEKRGGME